MPEGAAERRAALHLRGRCAARWALQALGIASGALLRTPHGSCDWPAGSLGSITHMPCTSYAAVARSAPGRGLGIDSQTRLTTSQAAELLPAVAGSAERARLLRLPARASPASLLFSAKESFYKALCSLQPLHAGTKAMEFDTVELLDCQPLASGHWRCRLQPAAWLQMPECMAWAVLDEAGIHTSVWLGCWD